MKIVIYTDGACLKNPGRGGWAFVARWEGKELSCAGFSPMTTNNRMEMLGAIEAIEKIYEKFGTSGELLIYSDSEYLVKGATSWMYAWEKNNWMRKKEPVKNVDLWKRIFAFSSCLKIQYRWVKGHNGQPLNEKCDSMAVKAARLQKSYREFIR